MCIMYLHSCVYVSTHTHMETDIHIETDIHKREHQHARTDVDTHPARVKTAQTSKLLTAMVMMSRTTRNACWST